ncbi:MAG: type VI secretion system membrane subunit TssM [Nitrincola lacisaponensis]|uniref:type VI secretion system membrane subunit TssM n=1 Tax=Nitrincola lacisaponensis TaxID=267850 RepID=UPI00391D70ED
MRMFLGVFKNIGGVLGLVALLVLAAIIWFVLPALSVGNSNPFQSALSRGSMIFTLFAVALVYKARTWILARKRHDQLGKGMVQQSDTSDGQQSDKANEAEFKGKFEEAIRLLKRQKSLGAGGNYLYSLPWYMLIGPPGSGKTTALINSGLHFPLMDQFGASIRGVGGTKNCDWWFTDQAILVDTAGRFTTQDNQQARDKKDWNTFLSLLAKYRKRKPINGIVVAYSVEDLVRKDEADIVSDAILIKKRIYELYDKLKIEFPVYLVFTKLDLLPGFEEFFGHLDSEGREQVWGSTFKISDRQEDPVSRYLVEHKLLTERLQLKVLDGLRNESDLNKRDAIYLFPRIVASLQDRISLLLDTSFKPTRFETDLMLRGVYFTSGIQDGTVLDKVISGLSAHLGRSRHGDGRKGKSYFIKNLLNEVVFKEAGLAGHNARFEKVRSMLYLSGYALVIAACLGMSALWYYSFTQNTKQLSQFNEAIADVEAQRQTLQESDHSIEHILPILNTSRDIPFGYSHQSAGRFAIAGFGLNQTGKMHSESVRLYDRALINLLLPRLVFYLEERLVRQEDGVFDDLKLYQMLGGYLEPDSVFISRYFGSRFRQYDAVSRQALEAHIQQLVGLLPQHYYPSLNDELIVRTQRSLLQQPVAARLLTQIELHAAADAVSQGYRLLDLMGTNGVLIFSVEGKSMQEVLIDGLYTRIGAQRYFAQQSGFLEKMLAEDASILGYDEALAERYKAELFRQYIQTYQKVWLDTLQSIQLVNIEDVQAKAQAIDLLTSDASPLRQLLSVVRDNTEFSTFFKSAGGDVSRLANPSSGAIVPVTLSDDLMSLLSLEVLPVFSQINRFAGSAEADDSELLSALLERLDALKIYLQGLQHSVNAERSAWMRASSHQGMGEVVAQLEMDVANLPQPLSTWLAQLLDSAKAETGSQARSYIQNQWASNVVPACRDMIEGRYPFAAGATREITLRDLASYFAAGGIVDDYFQTYLSPYVDRSRSPWRWQQVTGFESASVNTLLRQVELSNRIQNMFFGPRGDTPALSFEVVPRDVDPEILKVTLVIDNEELSYAHGPQLGRRFDWPSAQLTTQSFSRLVIETAQDTEAITERGDWSLFRLFDHGRMTRIDSERFLIEFSTRSGRRLSFELVAGSVYNPFDTNLFKSIRCN